MGMPKGEHGPYVSRLEPSHTDAGTVYVSFDNHRSADYGIYIFRSTNYGDSFERITNGIPPEAGTVHVIREDPVNQNLLFAGTEFGLFVSFDKGANWHRMKNGLPTVPVFDVQIHPREHDLILATHGRAIWIMDDISALEHLNDQVLQSDVKLFDNRPGIEWKMTNYRGFLGTSNFMAPNAPTGVILDYFAKSAGPVRITVADSAGKDIRTINARAEAGAINRATWDMRTNPIIPPAGRGATGQGGAGGRGGRGGGEGGGRGGGGEAAPAAETPAAPTQEGGEIATEFGAAGAAGGEGAPGGGGGGGGRGGRGGAPIVDPGQYKVTVTVAGKSDSRTVTVEEDPRVQFSDSDRARRRKAVDTLVSMAKDAEAGRKRAVAMTTALTSLTDSWKGNNAPIIPEAVRKAADDLLARAKKVSTTFEAQGGGRGFGGGGGNAGPPQAFTPPPVTQKIQRLIGTIDGYSAAPTTRQLADIDDCTAQLKKGLDDVNALWDEVPRFNKLMADAGVQYFTVNLNTVPPPTGGGRGGGR